MTLARTQRLSLRFNNLAVEVQLPRRRCSCLYAAAARFYGRPVAQIAIFTDQGVRVPCVAAPLPAVTAYQVRVRKPP